MSNLLLNAANWKDGSDTSPPVCWDGTSYVALNQEEDLTLTASVAAGDVVACTLSSTDGIGTVKVNSSLGALLATWGPVTEPTDFSIAAQAGMVLQIDSALGCSSDTLTLTPTAFAIGDLVRQQNTHRVYRGIDSPVKCYVRDEAGRVDLSNASAITVKLYRYGKTWAFDSIDATGDANGVVTFTVPSSALPSTGYGYDYGYWLDPRNLIRFDVFADGVLVYQALMEIV